jgi:hypothetical protein
VGTPDHNNWLPPAFASFEPHHDRGFRRASSSLQRPPDKSGPGTSRAKPVETLKATKLDVPQHPHHQSGTYGRLITASETAHNESRMSRCRWVGWTGLGWATPVGGQARIRSHRPWRGGGWGRQVIIRTEGCSSSAGLLGQTPPRIFRSCEVGVCRSVWLRNVSDIA